MPNDQPGREGRIPDRLPPLAQSPDAEPGAEQEGAGAGRNAPGADSPDDVEEPSDD